MCSLGSSEAPSDKFIERICEASAYGNDDIEILSGPLIAGTFWLEVTRRPRSDGSRRIGRIDRSMTTCCSTLSKVTPELGAW